MAYNLMLLKIFPLQIEDLLDLCKKQGLKIVWFDRDPLVVENNSFKTLVRSFYDAPNTI